MKIFLILFVLVCGLTCSFGEEENELRMEKAKLVKFLRYVYEDMDTGAILETFALLKPFTTPDGKYEGTQIMFNRCDTDNTEVLTFPEFNECLKWYLLHLGLPFNDWFSQRCFQVADVDQNQNISLHEMIKSGSELLEKLSLFAEAELYKRKIIE
jgi:hypothetical protein